MSDLPTNNWRLDHLGHAVRDIEQGIAFYTETLGLDVVSREKLESFQVEAVFLKAAGASTNNHSTIELLSPLSKDSLLTKFLEKKGEGLHHICFEVDSVVDELTRFKHLGVQLIDQAPRAGAHGMDVAFLHPHAGFGALIEICTPRTGI